eukprot:TRINITY_DN5716_c0_g1_i1.p1 TRINITY_DN5716_c0_g1~~TRINITY_DN5716_c0_g1_i1.p1  ORF type:complete len:214 (-),score=35.11 TRINITY_DN5716_c0_g1_i1:190-831(-)
MGLDGSNGFTITGKSNGDYLGVSVSLGGDVNNDDMIMGAFDALSSSGQVYVLFGKDMFPPAIDLNELLFYQQISFRNIVVETEQTFNFQINNTQLFSNLTDPVIDVTSMNLPPWLTFDQNNFTFTGDAITSGYFLIKLVARGSNGMVTGMFDLMVLEKKREFVITSDSPSYAFPIPDPSGGAYSYNAQLSTGNPLPPFIIFDSTNLVLSGPLY